MSAVRLSSLYEVSNNITVDLLVGSHSIGERKMALKHLNKPKQET